MRSLSLWFRKTFRGEAYALAYEKLRQKPPPERVIVLVSYGLPGGTRQVSCLEQGHDQCLVTLEQTSLRGDRQPRRESKTGPPRRAAELWRQLAGLGWTSLGNYNGGVRDGGHYQIAVGSGRQLKTIMIFNPDAGSPHLAVVRALEAFFQSRAGLA